MLLDHDRISTPPALWLSSTALVVGELSVRFLIYTRGMGRSLRTAALGILASFSLTHVAPMAALTAVLGRPMPWMRTSKFRADSTGLRRPLLDARAELRMLVLLAASGTALILLATSSLTTGLGIGLLLQAAMYLAAPVVAVLAERGLAAEISAATDQPFPATPSPTAGTDTVQIDLRRGICPPFRPVPENGHRAATEPATLTHCATLCTPRTRGGTFTDLLGRTRSVPAGPTRRSVRLVLHPSPAGGTTPPSWACPPSRDRDGVRPPGLISASPADRLTHRDPVHRGSTTARPSAQRGGGLGV
jgi:hypothetical protein